MALGDIFCPNSAVSLFLSAYHYSIIFKSHIFCRIEDTQSRFFNSLTREPVNRVSLFCHAGTSAPEDTYSPL